MLRTVLMCDRALGVDDGLLRRLHNAIGRVVRPAHDDRLLWCDCHGEGGEERNKGGAKCKAHVAGCRIAEVLGVVSLKWWIAAGVSFERTTSSVSGRQMRVQCERSW